MRYWPLTAVLLAESQGTSPTSSVETYIIDWPAWLWVVVVAVPLLIVVVTEAWLIRRVRRRRAATKAPRHERARRGVCVVELRYALLRRRR